jgi:Flp pilus assembly protein protease CpaA
MSGIYFPEPVFGWAYLISLLAILGMAAYHDLQALVVPKALTVFALGMGLLVNVLRGAWMGSTGGAVWILGANGSWVGGVDGLLFGLAGFGAGFALFFTFWVFGICGGGDVKLFAALGAWVGMYLLLLVLIGTIVVVFLLMLGRMGWGLATGRGVSPGQRSLPSLRDKGRQAPKARSRSQALGFSLPLALACVFVLPWVFRVDLRFVAPPPAGTEASTNLSTR